jgi:hypothetical protein
MSDRAKHLTRDELTLFHYGESGERASVARHLFACTECRAAYDDLLGLLEEVDSLPVPERGDDYGAKVWERLEPQLSRRHPGRSALGRPQRWALAASLILMLGAGFLAGRLFLRPVIPAPATGPIPEQVRERILLVAVGEHLERSQMVLLEVVNGDSLSLDAARRRARTLLAGNRLYRRTLADAGEEGIAAVLDDLERVLLDLAHSPAGSPEEVLDAIRDRIEERGLLFKVRILGTEFRHDDHDKQPVGLFGSRA